MRKGALLSVGMIAGVLKGVRVLAVGEQAADAFGNFWAAAALAAAILALVLSVALFLILRGALRNHLAETRALQRRVAELEKAKESRNMPDGEALEQLTRHIGRVERQLTELEEDVARLEREAAPTAARPQSPPVSYAAQTAEVQRPSVHREPTAHASVPPRGVPTGEGGDVERINRILDGSDTPERLLQKVYSPTERQQVRMLHYVHPSMKMQNQSYADFCAYGRINPGTVSVMRVGPYAVPYRLSLTGSGLADWYDVTREQDSSDPRPHMRVITPALVQETGENVVNEAQEMQKLLHVKSRGRLIAYNL